MKLSNICSCAGFRGLPRCRSAVCGKILYLRSCVDAKEEFAFGCIRFMCLLKFVVVVLYDSFALHILQRAYVSSTARKKNHISLVFLFILLLLMQFNTMHNFLLIYFTVLLRSLVTELPPGKQENIGTPVAQLYQKFVNISLNIYG